MKLSSASAALLSITASLLPRQTSALSCGIKGVTKTCIGETDIRYDPNVSLNIKDQSDWWSKREGLFIGELVSYTADGEKITEFYLDGMRENNLGSYNLSKVKTFRNTTIDGSRIFTNRYDFAKHNGDGIIGAGFPGLVLPNDYYYTGTFEKDGSIQSVAIQEAFGQELIFAENPSTVNPINDIAAMGLNIFGNITQTDFCLDEKCEQFMQSIEFYATDPETGKNSLGSFHRSLYTYVTKETWMSELSQTLDDFNIPSPDAPFAVIDNFDGPNFVKPFDPATESAPECYTLVCPTEDLWKKRDPAFGTSPYVEPDGVLTGGFIAGVSIGSIIVACLIFFSIYKRGVEERERRVKALVLKSITQTMNISASKALSPSELESMFTKIDTDGNGNLSKDEVKGLVEDAGVASMSDRDYDVLFNSIDLDKNGTLDFAEFCAFFTSISVEDEKDSFDEA